MEYVKDELFGVYQVIEKVKSTNRHLKYKIKCTICGKESIISGESLNDHKIKRKECVCKNLGDLYKSPTYKSWNMMKDRCSNKNFINYNDYGGRGIKFDEKWNTFRGFFKDMGLRPENTSLDRIDVNKGYYKENCRWATKSEQLCNTRRQLNENCGVFFRIDKKRWMSYIQFNGLKMRKSFHTKEEAILQRYIWEIELFGKSNKLQITDNIYRAGLKQDGSTDELQDLKKAKWYLEQKIIDLKNKKHE